MRHFLLIGLAGTLGACVGSIEGPSATGGLPGSGIDDPNNPNPPGSSGGTGGTVPGGTGGIAMVVPKTCDAPLKPAAPTPGPAPLRRLTRFEYNNTVLDLLGDNTNPATLFPPDTARFGFDNNATAQTVPVTLSDDYMDAADAIAGRAVLKATVLPVCAGAGQAAAEEACARTFIADFGKRAYRRPLTSGEITNLASLYAMGRALPTTHQDAIAMVLSSMLQSPGFLYRAEYGDKTDAPAKGVLRLTSWEMASRLSYLLWGSMPDPVLFSAAEADALKTPSDIATAAKRMLTDAKAHRGVARFHGQWLALDKLDAITKDTKTYPNFETVKGFMKEETARFVEDAFWQGDGSVTKLFTSPASFMNNGLATFLKLPAAMVPKTTAGFAKVDLDLAQRAGLLTQASFLSVQAKPIETSPVLRGKHILEDMLCVDVPPPPPTVDNTPPPAVAGQTTRERFELAAKAECASCHRIMHPPGFALENFDAAGRWRTTDAGKPVDSSGALAGTDVDGPFTGGVEMSARIAGSGQMRTCLIKNWFRYAIGREETGADSKSLQQLYCSFEAGNRNMRDLLFGITQMDSFLYKPASN